MYLKLING